MRSLRDIGIDDLLLESVEIGASDLHVTVALPPMVRVDGELKALDYEKCTEMDTQRIVYDALTDREIEEFEEKKELDFSYGLKTVSRFRFNVYRQRGSVGAAVRAIADRIPTMEEMSLPAIDTLKAFTQLPRGLVIVTGPTGSGKSTTLATMIHHINETRNSHVMTIENPIEYLHRHGRAMINQRELGKDTQSYANALRAVLREDPDVVLIGEMRDMETIEAVLTVAETGHLVLSTLHTNNAAQTVDRIVDVFPPSEQEQIRVQLSNVLEGVISQQLLPLAGGLGGRTVACEILVATPGIRNLIREGKSFQIQSAIETGAQYGMMTMDYSLGQLVKAGKVTREQAELKCIDRDNFERMLGAAMGFD